MKMEFEFERHHECIRNAHKFTFRSHKTSMSNFRCLGSEYILSNFVSGRQTNFRCNSMMHFDLTIHLVLENYGLLHTSTTHVRHSHFEIGFPLFLKFQDFWKRLRFWNSKFAWKFKWKCMKILNFGIFFKVLTRQDEFGNLNLHEKSWNF